MSSTQKSWACSLRFVRFWPFVDEDEDEDDMRSNWPPVDPPPLPLPKTDSLLLSSLGELLRFLPLPGDKCFE